MSGEHYFDLPIIGKYLKKVIINKEGGEKLSLTLRSYVSEKYKVNVGKYTYGSVFSSDFNIGGSFVNVGQYCSFASDVNYYGANHPYNRFSMSPYFYNKLFGFDVEDVDRFGLTIGHDVWIGANVTILDGVTICSGAVIGAGAIITKDVPANTILVDKLNPILRSRIAHS